MQCRIDLRHCITGLQFPFRREDSTNIFIWGICVDHDNQRISSFTNYINGSMI